MNHQQCFEKYNKQEIKITAKCLQTISIFPAIPGANLRVSSLGFKSCKPKYDTPPLQFFSSSLIFKTLPLSPVATGVPTFLCENILYYVLIFMIVVCQNKSDRYYDIHTQM